MHKFRTRGQSERAVTQGRPRVSGAARPARLSRSVLITLLLVIIGGIRLRIGTVDVRESNQRVRAVVLCREIFPLDSLDERGKPSAACMHESNTGA